MMTDALVHGVDEAKLMNWTLEREDVNIMRASLVERWTINCSKWFISKTIGLFYFFLLKIHSLAFI